MKFALFSAVLLSTSAAFASTADENRWYASAFGGYTYLSSNIKTYYYGYLLSDVDYFSGYNVGGSIGYKTKPFRYEFQYTYLKANADQYSVNYKPALHIDGRTQAKVLMGNVYYDFSEMFASISPFLGVGIGYAFMDASLNSTSRFNRPHFNTKQNSFAYQGIAGLTYNYSQKFDINVAYRYTSTTNTDQWGKPLQAQMVSAGVVYRFDAFNDK